MIGVGLAGTRDLVSFFKHATAADGNPLPGITRAIGWGVSQTGRFLRHFVYEGFNEDERGRLVFDGVFDQVGGAGRGSFNHRFGQQSRDQLQHFNILYPVDMFPFTDADQTDPETGVTDGVLRRAMRSNTVPKFFHLLTDSETSTAPARWCIRTSRARATSRRQPPVASTSSPPYDRQGFRRLGSSRGRNRQRSRRHSLA